MKNNEKKCPFCDETIKAKAKICRFCNRNLDESSDDGAPEVEARSGVMDGVKLGFGMFVVLPFLLVFGVIVFLITLGSCGKSMPQQSGLDTQPSPIKTMASPLKLKSQRLRSLAELTGMPVDGVTTEEIFKAHKRDAIISSKLSGVWADDIRALGHVARINCDTRTKETPNSLASAWLDMTWEKWISLSCARKQEILGLVGKYCGGGMYFFSDSDSNQGFGGWSPKGGATVFGPDNCNTK